MFDESIQELTTFIQAFEKKFIHATAIDEYPSYLFRAIESSLLKNPSREKITALQNLNERIETILRRGFESSRIVDVLGENEMYDLYELEKNIGPILSVQLNRYRQDINNLISNFELKAFENWRDTGDPVKLNISVAHLGMLINSLYEAEIINRATISKSEFCRIISKYCATIRTERMSYDALYNSLTSSRESEKDGFVKIINSILEKAFSTPVSDRKK